MTKGVSNMDTSDRSYLNFEVQVRRTFAFLSKIGFNEVEALPTLVRYRKGDIEVDVYHGRQSFEIGAGVSAFGTRYSMPEIIRAVDPNVGRSFRYLASTTPEGVASALLNLSSLMKHYGLEAIEGNSEFFSMIEKKRRLWAEEYALDVLYEQLRPQAYEAFRQKNYSKSADLYSRVKERLSPVELKKLSLAEERRRKEDTN